MPIQIELRDRAGRVLDTAEESWRSIAAAWPDLKPGAYPILAGVDRDSTTMLNPLQCHRAREEIDQLLASGERVPRELMERVASMATRCAESSDLELWFIGD